MVVRPTPQTCVVARELIKQVFGDVKPYVISTRPSEDAPITLPTAFASGSDCYRQG